MKIRELIGLGVALLGAAACSSEQARDRLGVTADGRECTCDASAPLIDYLPQTCDRDECKIEGAAIGQVGATVTTAGVTVTFVDWVPKADSPGEYVGFTIEATVPVGAIQYDVKTGGEVHTASGATWSHPDGDSGSSVPGISNVDFCDPDGGYEPPGGGDEPDGGGDDGGTCEDPDGCPEDGGDGGDDGGTCEDPDGCPEDGGDGGDGGHGDGGDDTCYCDPDAPPADDDGGDDDGACPDPDGCPEDGLPPVE